ncbi:MAG TPA: alpha/beta hydrolase [Methanospirillum sp.]|uniref:alpha/beta hydrolase n=1 Tax=Methanospirillum sp. TaxID=45200 RepID=UPI002BF811A7|nr:alpha/beta hydrolase [Methanospirillum sp.]HWQ63142.1 alpha/beta hydrolase [Methanospirillum sp.]
MIIPVSGTGLLIQASTSFILVGIVKDPFTLFIETTSNEYCQYLKTGDLVAISAPEGGELRQALILLELVMVWHVPLLVLPSGHPGSCRLKMVVSAGDQIVMNCLIQRGTHPEQTVICSSEELTGMEIRSQTEGVELLGIPRGVDLYRITTDGSSELIGKEL